MILHSINAIWITDILEQQYTMTVLPLINICRTNVRRGIPQGCVQEPLKADSQIPCRSHAVPMPFPCSSPAVPLLLPCRTPTMPFYQVFRLCLFHLIHIVRPCFNHTCHAVPLPFPYHVTNVPFCKRTLKAMAGSWKSGDGRVMACWQQGDGILTVCSRLASLWPLLLPRPVPGSLLSQKHTNLRFQWPVWIAR
jgi:hypothetical protein